MEVSSPASLPLYYLSQRIEKQPVQLKSRSTGLKSPYFLNHLPVVIVIHCWQVNAQDLEDTYQPPFKTCIQEARASCVMCAYNQVNGVPMCAHKDLLQKTRDEWGFQGYAACPNSEFACYCLCQEWQGISWYQAPDPQHLCYCLCVFIFLWRYITSDCDAVAIIHENQTYTKSDEDSIAIVLKAG